MIERERERECKIEGEEKIGNGNDDDDAKRGAGMQTKKVKEGKECSRFCFLLLISYLLGLFPFTKPREANQFLSILPSLSQVLYVFVLLINTLLDRDADEEKDDRIRDRGEYQGKKREKGKRWSRESPSAKICHKQRRNWFHSNAAAAFNQKEGRKRNYWKKWPAIERKTRSALNSIFFFHLCSWLLFSIPSLYLFLSIYFADILYHLVSLLTIGHRQHLPRKLRIQRKQRYPKRAGRWKWG